MKFILGIHPNALAYSMTTLGAGMMNSIFNFYYVKLFLNRYKISEVAFHQAQVVFMIWNAVNDPLFGYIQDNSKFACCSRRQFSILYGAPLYALAFLLPWFPWKHYEEVFHLAFCNNFMMIFADNLIPKDVLSSLIRSIMYGAGFICPQCLVLLSHASLKKFGYYRIILFSFYLEGVAAAVMFVLGPEHYYLLAFYLTTNIISFTGYCNTVNNKLNFITCILQMMKIHVDFPRKKCLRVIVQASFSLFNLPLADIVDADLIKHKRRSPLSSMVFGTNALFTKPAQSLAPMLVVTILNQFGYENLNNEVARPDLSLFLGLHDAMFYLICLVPLCIAVIQILTWTPFSIQNSHMTAAH
ncbi:transmembrane protein 180 isoform X3 [Falco cherrug]|uniref:transmembrane protein 180 isoform X3 n=1 Tax=Falco cherrug TaxID=345164 RepID=UPI00247B0A30|nr:transmembrane protein 180 isoform X3 [Falco cherrug]